MSLELSLLLDLVLESMSREGSILLEQLLAPVHEHFAALKLIILDLVKALADLLLHEQQLLNYIVHTLAEDAFLVLL